MVSSEKALSAFSAAISPLDLLARVLIEEIAAAGGEAILLKGRSFASAFYDDRDVRRVSADVDLLVPAAAMAVVGSVLEKRSYVADDARNPGDHAITWRHKSLPAVDVHQTLGGLRAPSEDVWEAVSRYQRPLSVAGAFLPTLDIPVLALHAAMHATQHGGASARTIDDLRRAIAGVEEPAWRVAHQLARELEGLDAFATGLRLLPEGRDLAARIGVPPVDTALAAVRAESTSGGAWLLANVADARALSARLYWARWAIAPPAPVMRNWYPDHPVAAAYLVRRPLRILTRARPAMRELQLARRSARARMANPPQAGP